MKRKFLALALLTPFAFAPITACSNKEPIKAKAPTTLCAHITGDIIQVNGWKNTIAEAVNGCFILTEDSKPNTGYFKLKGLENEGWLRAETVEVVVNCEYCKGETLNEVYGGK